MRRIVAFGPAFVVLATAGVVLLAAPEAIRRISGARTEANVSLARHDREVDDILERVNRATRSIAQAVEPSVVHIEVWSATGPRSANGSSGSGWIYDTQGHVVTNAHVVAGGTRLQIQLHDGQVMRGELVGADPLSDIAVIRIRESTSLIPMERATLDRPELGDTVFAFGSPFGFKFSMTTGIVSGLGRSARGVAGSAGVTNYIQTDAPINPGNSGGPLVDIHGRLVGMSTAIATNHSPDGTTEGQSAGIGFAIPLATIESRVPQLISTGTPASGFLGIRFQGSTFIDDEGTNGKSGYRGRAFPVEVQAGTPADRAGLRTGDAIISINGTSPSDEGGLRSLIASEPPGSTIELRVWRNGTIVSIRATLVDAPSTIKEDQLRRMLLERGGLRVFTRRRSGGGVVIDAIMPGAVASDAGLRVGMRITQVNGTPIADESEFLRTLSAQGFFVGMSVNLSVESSADSGEVAQEFRLDLAR